VHKKAFPACYPLITWLRLNQSFSFSPYFRRTQKVGFHLSSSSEQLNYIWAETIIRKYIPESGIDLVAEIGSRDALDGIALSKFYGCPALIFEPDPLNVELCRENIAKCPESLNLQLFEVALSEQSGVIDFYSIDPKLYSNRGSSGMYQINFRKRNRRDLDRNRDSVQRKVIVQASRFEDLELPTPDLIAIDVEGAELSVFKGFGGKLVDVKVIIAETSFWNNYIGGGSTFPEINQFLSEMGFEFIASNRRHTRQFPKQHLRHRLRKRYQPAFDVVYINRRFLITTS